MKTEDDLVLEEALEMTRRFFEMPEGYYVWSEPM